ncbi:MAG TPA: hypothetical protein VNU70_12060 [Puia sp.]|jgi:hypothetical protein|nr:hypothetical protein [Puia sp.]
MRTRITILLAGILFYSEARAQVPVESERHHRTIFRNDYVRILEGRVRAHDTTPAHVHAANSVVIFLSTSRLGIQNTGEQPVVTDVSPGDMKYRDYGDKPVTHIVWNDSPSELHFLVVELAKSHTGGSACPSLSATGLSFQWSKPSVAAYGLRLGDKGLCRLPASGCARLLIDLSGTTTVVGAEGSYTRQPEGFVFVPSGRGIDIRGDNARCILLEMR